MSRQSERLRRYFQAHPETTVAVWSGVRPGSLTALDEPEHPRHGPPPLERRRRVHHVQRAHLAQRPAMV